MKRSSTIVLWIGASVVALALGWLAAKNPLYALIGVAGLAAGVALVLSPRLGLFLSLLSMIAGQMIRIPLFSEETSIIPNDILLPVLFVSWLLANLVSRRFVIRWTTITAPLLAVIAAMVLSLVVNAGMWERKELLVAALFFARFLEYVALFVMVPDIIRTKSDLWFTVRLLIGIGVIVALLGFVQLRMFPDFSFMVPKGWDPHIGRLLSTWFDPNFLSGFFVVALMLTLSQAVIRSPRQALPWFAAAAVLGVAILFTFSRSGYVALAAGFGVLTVVRARWLLALGIFVAIGVFVFSPRVQERVIGIRTIDETAQLRLVSWNDALTVIHDHPIVGIGYNAYRYAQRDYGFISDTREHSASGSDSSLLTMWVTTGIIGLVALGWLWAASAWFAWRMSRSRALGLEERALALGVLASLAGLFLHAQFVNSFFYPHLMEVFWVLLALLVVMERLSRQGKEAA